jgi:hypothetical protein
MLRYCSTTARVLAHRFIIHVITRLSPMSASPEQNHGRHNLRVLLMEAPTHTEKGISIEDVAQHRHHAS